MYNELVTVIIPCYNAGKYIKETIASVLKQTYQSWELLAVDDCSTDDTADIIRKLGKGDARIRLLSTSKNTGSPAEPRNIGLREARGEFVAFLDADDIWYETKLDDQVELMNQNNYAITYCNGNMIDESGNILRCMKKATWVDYRRTLKRNELSCSSVMMRKEIIGDLKFLNIPKEDFVFWLQLMRTTGLRAYNTNKTHYAYRLVTNSRSRNKKSIIKQQWNVLRKVEGLSLIDASYCFLCWALRNIRKYYM